MVPLRTQIYIYIYICITMLQLLIFCLIGFGWGVHNLLNKRKNFWRHHNLSNPGLWDKLKTILSICCLWNLFQFDPDLVLVSAGFDSAQGDPKVEIGLCTLNPFTSKISSVILWTVCHIVLVMLVWRIWY